MQLIESSLRDNGLWQYIDLSSVSSEVSPVTPIFHPKTGLWLIKDRTLVNFTGDRFVSYPAPLREDQRFLGIAITRARLILLCTNDMEFFRFDGVDYERFDPGFKLADPRYVIPYGDAGLSRRLPGKLFLYDGKRTRVITHEEGCPDETGAVLEDPEGILWLISASGISRYDGRTFEKFEAPAGLLGDGWRGSVYDPHTRSIWIEGFGGLVRFHDNKFTYEELPPEHRVLTTVFPSLVDSLGNVWAKSFPNLCVYRRPDGKFVRLSSSDGLLTDYPLRILGEDAEAGLWFFCAPAGICRYDRKSASIVSRDYVGECMTRETDGTVLWASGNKLNLYDGEEKEPIQTIDHVLDISCGSDGYSWVASFFGVSRFRQGSVPEKIKWGGSGVYSRAVLCASDGTVWFGFHKDLLHYRNGEISKYGIDVTGLNRISSIVELGGGSILIASFAGGGVRQFDGGKSRPFEPFADPRIDAVYCLTVGANNTVWAGLHNAVACYDGAALHIFGPADGIKGQVKKIFVDSRGTVWIATLGGGVVRYDGRNFQILTKSDMLPSNCVTGICEEPGGSFLISTYSGVIRFKPNYASHPSVRIEKVVADQQYTEPDEISFSELVPRMSVTFAGTTFKSVPLRFTYKLDGYDKDWRRTLSDTVSYAGLPSGEYELKVRSVDRDLVRSPATATLRIRVLRDERQNAIAELKAEVAEKTHELNDAKDFAANILQSMNDAIFVLNRDGTIRTMNYGALHLLGHDQAELIGMDAGILFPEKDARLVSKINIAQIIDEGSIRNQERTLVAKNGQNIPVLFSASCMRDPHGNVQGIVAVASDLREHKQMQQRLQAAQKMESIGVLAGGVAHDFNNLLVGIIGNAELLSGELGADSPLQQETTQIIKAGESAAKLCREMLAYAGKGSYIRARVDISRAAEHLVPLLKTSISKKVILRLQLDANLPAIDGDEAQISQVIMNLIINASEAIGDRDGVITVRTKCAEYDSAALRSPYFAEAPASGRYVSLEVEDNGCGIDDRIRKTLFEPFASTKFTGRGLGLAAVHGIVRGHKGAIHLESQVGVGTKFIVYFHATERPAQDKVKDKTVVAAPDLPSSGTVLVADDEEIVLTLAKRVLEKAGFTVLTARDGRECVDIFMAHANEVTIMLVDMTMPEMNGCEVVEHVLSINPSVPVIISSGYTKENVASRFSGDKRPVDFLQKPFSNEKMIATVKAALASRKGQEA